MWQSNWRRQLFRPQKTAAKDIGMKAIDVRKTVAIDAGKKLDEKAAKKLCAPKSQVANVMVPPEDITKKVNEVIAKYVDTSAINLNKLIAVVVEFAPFRTAAEQVRKSQPITWLL